MARRRTSLCRIGAFLAALAWPALAAAQGWLGLPVSCQIGQDCFVLQHFDHDPGPGHLDFQCRARAYDTHTGVDIGLGTEAEMRRNVPVVAAAPGTVRAVRDGEVDGLAVRQGIEAVPKGRNCGNAVILEHGGGWETRYCHLKRGSVAVQPGQKVAAGAQLGAIGMSGLAEFPHLHFGVAYQGKSFDPYRPSGAGKGKCGPAAQLWTPAAAAALAYSPLDLVAVGAAPGKPDFDLIHEGRYDNVVIAANAPGLVAWAVMWNVEAGDRLLLTITAPDGQVVIRDEQTIDRQQRRRAIFGGRRARGAWPRGELSVRAEILRPSTGLRRVRESRFTIR